LILRDLLYLSFGAILGIGAALAVGILPSLFQWIRATLKSVAAKLANENQLPPI